MIIRACVCIPTFNNPTTIAEVVEGCLRETLFPILVIDDGSDLPVGPFANPRVEVLRLRKNQGKGAALQAGFQIALKKGFTHLIAVDGDGQHPPAEISKLVERAKTDPWALIIGRRIFEGKNIPRSTQFGRKFSNFWVKQETDKIIEDSQSGLRIYPLFQLQSLRFFTRRYDFEIEVLIRLVWKGVRVHEVPVQVYYPPAETRVSHFKKFHDNLRISLLNTLLMTVSLFRMHLSSWEIAFALFLGVLVGCTPFFGFHTAIVAGLSLILHLNAGVMFLGSQISLPFLAPFLAYLSISAGRAWGGEALSVPKAWLLGSLLVGTGLGVVFGAIGFFLSQFLRLRTARKVNWTGRTRGGVFGNWFLKLVLRKLGVRAAYSCLFFIVPYFYFFAPRSTRASLEYWKRLRPDAGFFSRSILVLKHYYRFGTVLMDRLYQSYRDKPQFTATSSGFENISGPIAKKQGVILLGAHVGGWDTAARYMEIHNFQMTFHPVQYESPAATFTKLKRQEERYQPQTLFTNQNSQPILTIHRLLSDGKPVGIMGDRPTGKNFELVSFLGGIAAFDTTPFRIAAANSAPLVFTYGFKGPNQTYLFHASPVRHYAYKAEKDRELQCLEWAQEFASDLETRVRAFPDQWFNFYPFFSSPPAPPLATPTLEKKQENAIFHPLLQECRS
jgi:predicted LPLAT superfamily acyltransferase